MTQLISALVGAMIMNFDSKDPEWKIQAGYLAEILESGGIMPQGKALGGICRIAGQRILTREQIIQWAREQERAIN